MLCLTLHPPLRPCGQHGETLHRRGCCDDVIQSHMTSLVTLTISTAVGIKPGFMEVLRVPCIEQCLMSHTDTTCMHADRHRDTQKY